MQPEPTVQIKQKRGPQDALYGTLRNATQASGSARAPQKSEQRVYEPVVPCSLTLRDMLTPHSFLVNGLPQRISYVFAQQQGPFFESVSAGLLI
jgi:hypothetical protein